MAGNEIKQLIIAPSVIYYALIILFYVGSRQLSPDIVNFVSLIFPALYH